jgi:tetratricopeptide (TPR) repeat protein
MMRRYDPIIAGLLILTVLYGCTAEADKQTTAATSATTSVTTTTVMTTTTTTKATTTTKVTTTLPNTIFEPVKPVREGALEECIANAEKYAQNLYAECARSAVDQVKDNSLFEKANDYYKAGKYQKALDTYYEFLKLYPAHIGALNNKGLALLQLEKNESALTNYLILYNLYPKYYQSFINLQIAAHACGYSAADLMEQCDEFINHLVDASAADEPGADVIIAAFAYNLAYEAMETDGSREDLMELIETAKMLYIYSPLYFKETGEYPKEADIPGIAGLLELLSEMFPEDEDVAKLTEYYAALTEVKKKS